jgi:hypothetical protein
VKFLTPVLASLAFLSSSVQANEAKTMASFQPTLSRADIQAVAPALDKYTHERLLGEVWKRSALNVRDRRSCLGAFVPEADIAVAHLQQEASIFLWSHFRQLLGRVES